MENLQDWISAKDTLAVLTANGQNPANAESMIANDVTPGFHPAGTRDRRLLWCTSAHEATAWTRPGRCFSISAAKAAGVA